MSEMYSDFLVSVIIPSFGRNEYLTRAIDSVLKQTYSNVEIIVINDNAINSKAYDEFNKIIEKYANTKVYFVSDGINVGGGGARNKGIDRAHGEFITFLDDDDYYIADKVEKQLKFMLANNLDLSLCYMHFLENENLRDVSNCIARGSNIAEFLIEGNAYTPMIMVKADLIKSVQGFENTPRFQDHVLMVKLLGTGTVCGILTEKLFVHNNHIGERITFSDKTCIGYKKRWEIESKYTSCLNEKKLRSYNLKKKSVEAKMYRAQNKISASLACLSYVFRNIRDLSGCILFIRTFVRILFFPYRPV